MAKKKAIPTAEESASKGGADRMPSSDSYKLKRGESGNSVVIKNKGEDSVTVFPPDGETIADEKQETPTPSLRDKTYSYMVADSKGILRRHSFKESEATEEDIMHFVRTLGEVYDKAPKYAKINFIAHAFPVMRRYLREHDPEILAAIMHEAEKNPN